MTVAQLGRLPLLRSIKSLAAYHSGGEIKLTWADQRWGKVSSDQQGALMHTSYAGTTARLGEHAHEL